LNFQSLILIHLHLNPYIPICILSSIIWSLMALHRPMANNKERSALFSNFWPMCNSPIILPSIYEFTTYNFYENNGNNKWVKMKMVNYVTTCMVNSKPTLEWNTNTKIPSSIWQILQDCIYNVSAHLLIEVDNDKKTFMCAVNEVWWTSHLIICLLNWWIPSS
jgi:hypothetical protein